MVRTVRLFFNQRSNDGDFLQIISSLLCLRQQIIIQLAVEVAKQSAQGIGGFLVHIELIGVREKVAFQSADIRRAVVNEIIIKIIGLGRLKERIFGVDAVFRQQLDGLRHRIALRDRHSHCFSRHVSRAASHSNDQSTVIHFRIQFIRAHADLLFCLGKAGKQFEEPFIFDKARLFQLVSNRAYRVFRCDLHGRFRVLLIEGAQVGNQQPADACQQHGNDYYE